jgi:hypothetical protein
MAVRKILNLRYLSLWHKCSSGSLLFETCDPRKSLIRFLIGIKVHQKLMSQASQGLSASAKHPPFDFCPFLHITSELMRYGAAGSQTIILITECYVYLRLLDYAI